MLKKTDSSTLQSYLEDSSNLQGGYAEGIYLPENEAEILEALKECSSKKVSLTISGGTTGTTGGCIPFGGWVLGTEKLNKIIDIDIKGKKAVVQPAVTLAALGVGVGAGLLYPPDPTESTAFLGGTVATNASGSRSFRFGSTRNWVKRLKVILSTGEILNISRGRHADASRIPHYSIPNVKTSAGYYSSPGMDLMDLFIGAEGTLGVVTEIEVGLIPAFYDAFDVVAFFKTEEKAVDFVFEAKRETDALTLEYFDKNSLGLLRADYPRIPAGAGAAVYMESEITEKTASTYLDKWSALLEKHGADLDKSWLGMNDKQKKELRDFRHSMPEHINEEFKKHNTIKFASDISVPDDKFREMLAFYNSNIESQISNIFSVKFGHIGQNHLHVNLVPKTKNDIDAAKNMIMEFVKKAVKLGGTCSAEHGIGKIKHPYLREMFGDEGIREMVRVKKLFDPACILNQGNMFPRELLAV